MNSCWPIAALAAYHLCFVAEVVGKACFECAHMCLVCQDETGGLESVPSPIKR